MPIPAPAVSVCIPVSHGEPYLAETIRSVLDQTYRDFELVVLDNASPDRAGVDRAAVSATSHPGGAQHRAGRRWPRTGTGPCSSPRSAGQAPCADDLLHPRCLDCRWTPWRPTRAWPWSRPAGTWSTSRAGWSCRAAACPG